ncbi:MULTISPECIES: L,D-transpeptidase [Gordonia]|uniref:L,D-TPase catalytic domain-containing protein n=2 Tax=Gordonia TaxID=2053 RepID=L7LN18_9ACTN|nr:MULTISPECIES: L,D-transpeptidase [Gordonia]KJR09151.1 hypothetical protein UG54_05605 [Gordonia sihwensis]KXT57044.1 hypothetical protein Y710_11225 [Gordonia sp. QH-12]MBY4571888.1 L,D-transpeptidase [Gordonia sihwensis]GAC62515.1 hypothetical protein GSI01S_36_00100 [Gordonia sihwensis NBRC 108236]
MAEVASGNRLRSGVRGYAAPLALATAALVVTVALLLHLTWNTNSAAVQPATHAAAVPASTISDPAAIRAAGSAECRTNAPGRRLIRVSLSQQAMWMCDGRRPVSSSPVTTGNVARGDGTPTGTWTVQSRETNRDLVGPGYRDHVRYWLPFFGDFGFHDAPWQKTAFGDREAFKTAGSRGCVHVPGPEMKHLYDWAEVGTTVTVAE